MTLIVILAAGALGLSVPVLWWALASGRPVRAGLASSNLRQGTVPADLRAHALSRPLSERAGKPLAEALAGVARRVTPAGLLDQLERRLVLAGRPASWPLERILAAKVVLAASFALFAGLQLLSGAQGLALLLWLGSPALAFFAPDLLLSSQASKRQEAIRLALPDTLDQLTICVEAGLGFDAAMSRAARNGQGPLADELLRSLQDMQIGSTRAEALRSLADRTEVAELRRFVLALLQAESYGLPLADVLRVQAGELRDKRRQRAEERAMKVPVKIVIPLILFILPTLFIVVIGPAAINIVDMFGSM